MINLKNFKRGEPKTPQQKELALAGAWLLFDENGNEWYESQKLFASDTMKVAYLENGVIAAIATNFTDVSSLFPDNMSVAEVEDTPENRRAENTGGWVFDGKRIAERVYTQQELTDLADAKKNRLIAAASKIIAPLQDAIDLGIATDEEAQRLYLLKKYRVMLNRVDLVNPAWPEVLA